MAKEREETPQERAERKAAKKIKKDAEKLHSKVEKDGVKKERKEKKEKKSKTTNGVVAKAVEAEVKSEAPKTNGEKKEVKVARPVRVRPVGKMAYFADPLADDKTTKRLFKHVEKAAQSKTIRRGVKEVNKAIKQTGTTPKTLPDAIAIVAADVSPPDVVGHLPLFCESHYVDYVFVRSRDALGKSSLTTRPTSVVLLCKETKQFANLSQNEKDAWVKDYESLCKLVKKVERQQSMI